ncbi:hypothetical protein BP6252_14064 [Coleophoma cylindrospora]|uniref:Uncharacterized protein n=1 Tax=Coleophoma cylindrospora TaxID=1849047 RepID=A0A3D8Q4W7_9HELO|nr:hypothetical protein BP6252_14064 [Coleophoma cylindrospora]
MDSSWDARLEASLSPTSKKRKMFNEPAAQSAQPNSAPASNLAKDNLHGRLEEVFNTRIRAYAICAIDEASMLHSKISTYSTEEDQLRLMSIVAPEFLNGCATAQALEKVAPGTEGNGFGSRMSAPISTPATRTKFRLQMQLLGTTKVDIIAQSPSAYTNASQFSSPHFTSGPPIPDYPSSPYTMLTYPSPRRYDFSTSKWVEDPMYSLEMNGSNMDPRNEDHGS